MKGENVVYIDPKGAEHEALVRALNGLNPGYITISYVDVDAPEGDNLKTVYDIPHISDESKAEPNPALPKIELNCWKEHYESHTVAASDHPMFDHPFDSLGLKRSTKAASDHPMFDHPFAEKEKDEFGKVIEKDRPGYAAQVAAHNYPQSAEGEPTGADLDKDAEEKKAKEATSGKVRQIKGK